MNTGFPTAELRERLTEMKRKPWPRASMANLTPNDRIQETWDRIAVDDALRAQVDAYLRNYTIDDCPGCGHGFFGWGIAWGTGECACGWPGSLYHQIRDTRKHGWLACTATCNGIAVCHDARSDHIPTEIHWQTVDGDESRTEIELRCPNPKQPPGLTRPITSRYQAPLIVEFTGMLWSVPYAVHARSEQ